MLDQVKLEKIFEDVQKRGGARAGAGRKHTGSKLHKLPGKLHKLKKLFEIFKAQPPKPYGNVKYADPSEGKYPIDTPEHIRAAWNYVNKEHNKGVLGDKASSTRAAIISAWKKHIDPAGPPSIQKTYNVITELVEVIEKGGPGSGRQPSGSNAGAGQAASEVRVNRARNAWIKATKGSSDPYNHPTYNKYVKEQNRHSARGHRM